MKIKFIYLFILTIQFVSGQEMVNWQDLTDVSFTEKYTKELEDNYAFPTFGESVIGLDNKKITISGYFLDLSSNGTTYILSKNPFASCFFCGNGGPETVIEIHFNEKQTFKTDQLVTITGTLQLNDTDVNHTIYAIKVDTAFSL